MRRYRRRIVGGFVIGLTMMTLAGCTSGGRAGHKSEQSMAVEQSAPQGDNTQKTGEKTVVEKISAEEAKKRMEAGGVTIVDVRTPEEYADGYIPDAVNVPNEAIGTEMPEALPDKEAKLLVYCRSGRRSAEAAEKLAKIGYEHVADFGGIMDWPYEVTDGE